MIFICRFSFSLVMGLVLLSCLGMPRFIALAAITSLMTLGWVWPAGRSVVARGKRMAVVHPIWSLVVMTALAVIVRLAYAFSLDGGLSSAQLADAENYWRWAGEFASGSFPDVKCWTAPAGYALIRRAFGDSLPAAVGLNLALQIITSFVLFAFGRKAFGVFSGLLAAAVYLLSPTFVMMWGMTIAEHFFIFLAALAFWGLACWNDSLRLRWAFVLPAMIWLATWTRGEGVLLAGAVFAWGTVRCCCDSAGRKGLLVGLGVFFLVFGLGAALGTAVNLRYHGTRTAFCSNDNYWPRLHGADISTRGRVTGKRYIKNLYLADHPDDPGGVIANMRPQTCPKELIPYIEREISRRWSAMPFWMKVRFVLEKERYVWSQSFMGNGRPESPRSGREWLGRVGQELIPAAVCLLTFAGLWRLRRVTDGRILSVAIAPACYLLGMVAVLAVYESNVRYGVMLLVLLPFYASAAEERGSGR